MATSFPPQEGQVRRPWARHIRRFEGKWVEDEPPHFRPNQEEKRMTMAISFPYPLPTEKEKRMTMAISFPSSHHPEKWMTMATDLLP